MLQITYDIYKPYVRKHASGRELLLVSRLSVAFFGLVMALVSIIFYKVSMGNTSMLCQLCMLVRCKSTSAGLYACFAWCVSCACCNFCVSGQWSYKVCHLWA